jgi:hypothetical protein
MASAALALALVCGCDTTEKQPLTALPPAPERPPMMKVPDRPPCGEACRAVAYWQPQVQYQPDPARNGAPGPVLVGRLYLMDGEIKQPLAVEGSLVVDLYDMTSGQEVMMEEWRIDASTLKRLLRRDPIGWGYTVGLPWSTFKPEVARVQLKLRFDPLKGAPLYDLGQPMTLLTGTSATPTVVQAAKR